MAGICSILIRRMWQVIQEMRFMQKSEYIWRAVKHPVEGTRHVPALTPFWELFHKYRQLMDSGMNLRWRDTLPPQYPDRSAAVGEMQWLLNFRCRIRTRRILRILWRLRWSRLTVCSMRHSWRQRGFLRREYGSTFRLPGKGSADSCAHSLKVHIGFSCLAAKTMDIQIGFWASSCRLQLGFMNFLSKIFLKFD